MSAQVRSRDQIGKHVEALGTHLRSHFDEVGAEASAQGEAFEKSIRGLLSALEDGFGAARSAVGDPQLREDISAVASSMREMLLAAFADAEEQVRERIGGQAGAVKPRAARSPAPRTTSPRRATSPTVTREHR